MAGVSKDERKKLWDDLVQKATHAPDPPENFADSDFAERFEQFWPVIEAALKYAQGMKITGKKTDARLGTLIAIGENIVGETGADADQEEFINTMKKVWGIASRILNVATAFTGDDTDKVINKIISIGDWITQGEEDDDDDDDD